jgi:Exonuclease VII, large subunit
MIEDGFSYVRVRGEVGRVSRPSSGHLYFDLKEGQAVLSAVCWRSNVARLAEQPMEGQEMILTGRLTTSPGPITLPIARRFRQNRPAAAR